MLAIKYSLGDRWGGVDLAAMASEFSREILEIQGNQSALEELQYREKLERLNELHARAGNISDEEYNDAVSKLNELHRLKLEKLAEEEAARIKSTKSLNASTDSTASSMSNLADQAERAKRAVTSISTTDLSGIYKQVSDLGQAARGLAETL